jgi:hypothetical protein
LTLPASLSFDYASKRLVSRSAAAAREATVGA